MHTKNYASTLDAGACKVAQRLSNRVILVLSVRVPMLIIDGPMSAEKNGIVSDNRLPNEFARQRMLPFVKRAVYPRLQFCAAFVEVEVDVGGVTALENIPDNLVFTNVMRPNNASLK